MVVLRIWYSVRNNKQKSSPIALICVYITQASVLRLVLPKMDTFCFVSLLLSAAVFVQPAQGVSCPTCMHLSYTVSGVPTSVKSVIHNLLYQAMPYNPKCQLGSHSVVESCPASSLLEGTVTKCQTTYLTVSARGLFNIASAKMAVSVWIKNCVSVPESEEDTCVKLSDMDEATRSQLTAQLEVVSRLWNTVRYNGDVCISTPWKSRQRLWMAPYFVIFKENEIRVHERHCLTCFVQLLMSVFTCI